MRRIVIGLLLIGCGKGEDARAVAKPAPPPDAALPPDIAVRISTHVSTDADADKAYAALAAWSRGRCPAIRTPQDHSITAAHFEGGEIVGVGCGGRDTKKWTVGVVRMDALGAKVLGAKDIETWDMLAERLSASPTRFCFTYATLELDKTTKGIEYCAPSAGSPGPADADPPFTEPLADLAARVPDEKTHNDAYAVLTADTKGMCPPGDVAPADDSALLATDGDTPVVALSCHDVDDTHHVGLLAVRDGRPALLGRMVTTKKKAKVAIMKLRSNSREVCATFAVQADENKDDARIDVLCVRRKR